MTNINHPRRRSGFTLIELLVIIAIIAVLASLGLAATMKVLGWGPRLQTINDIQGMTASLGKATQSEYKLQYAPSKLVLYETLQAYRTPPPIPPGANYTAPDIVRSAEVLGKMFPLMFRQQLNPAAPSLRPTVDWNNDGILPPDNQPGAAITTQPFVLEGDQALVFYLGGIPNVAQNQCLGFNTNTVNPAAPSQQGEGRRGPYFSFKTKRLVARGGFFSYVDPYGNVYAYFSSINGNNDYRPTDCATIQALPYYSVLGTATPPTPTQWLNPNSFQIISAGLDAKFYDVANSPVGTATTGLLYNPANGTTDAFSRDNYANFTRGQLANPQN